ncbi:endonuclease NucS [Robbsia sp. Bb-Pol-6]|uniref:Endonuclease NucS n=1 Tax=Robbsia betulipollinis TaxID=2981849 RepID=A0ABT3ZTM4_9BURK|nr:endonuclease NucS domain-containing protein [Robbsia betulipollinis]MCY0389914.1 endonuclease NucS [Robbsia betulipollinis]
MDERQKTPIWEMLKSVMEKADGEMTYPAIKQALREQYPDATPNSATVNCQIIICSVNAPSRVHYPENRKPRTCTGRYDFLYTTGRGKVVWYNPVIHGDWEIAEGPTGLVVRSSDDTGDGIPVPSLPEQVSSNDVYGAFALEAHLRDYLAKNLPTLPGHTTPLRLHVDDGGSGREGVEYQTDVGQIDLLATGTNGDFYVLELKLLRGVDKALGQILRYMGWVQKHLANGKRVFGVIVASEVLTQLKYAATQVPNVLLMEYRLLVALQPVALKPATSVQ